MKNNRKIKQFLILPSFQLKYISGIILLDIILSFGIFMVFYHFIEENYFVFIKLSPMSEDMKILLTKEFQLLLFILISSVSIFLLLLCMVAIYYSHRIAGPIFHLQKTMTEITNGDHKLRVQFRPSDEFQELAQTFNKMMDQLEQEKEKGK